MLHATIGHAATTGAFRACSSLSGTYLPVVCFAVVTGAAVVITTLDVTLAWQASAGRCAPPRKGGKRNALTMRHRKQTQAHKHNTNHLETHFILLHNILHTTPCGRRNTLITPWPQQRFKQTDRQTNLRTDKPTLEPTNQPSDNAAAHVYTQLRLAIPIHTRYLIFESRSLPALRLVGLRA